MEKSTWEDRQSLTQLRREMGAPVTAPHANRFLGTASCPEAPAPSPQPKAR